MPNPNTTNELGPDIPLAPSGPTYDALRVLLIGDSGEGKTYSLSTLLEVGLDVFVIFTENSLASFRKAIKDKNLDSSHFHYKYISPATEGWTDLLAQAKQVNTLTPDFLSKAAAPNRQKYQQFMALLESCNNFVDQRGNSFGDVGTWGPDRVLVIDSMSGLNDMALSLVKGSRPTTTQPEWQISQNEIRSILRKLLTALPCHFVMTGHLARNTDPITGATRTMISSLGKALAPDIPRNFDEVVLAKREGSNFYWSTTENGYVLKQRLLPLSSKITPSFVQLFEAWKANIDDKEVTDQTA